MGGSDRCTGTKSCYQFDGHAGQAPGGLAGFGTPIASLVCASPASEYLIHIYIHMDILTRWVHAAARLCAVARAIDRDRETETERDRKRDRETACGGSHSN